MIGELELNGYAIERVYEHARLVGLRLIEPEDADTGARGRRHWWSCGIDRLAAVQQPWLLRHPPQPPRRGHADPRKSFASR